MPKQYLGDSVYVDENPVGQLVLTTDNGHGASNTIYFEPEVLAALLVYIEKLHPGALKRGAASCSGGEHD